MLLTDNLVGRFGFAGQLQFEQNIPPKVAFYDVAVKHISTPSTLSNTCEVQEFDPA